MATFNLGSIQVEVGRIVRDIPSSLSGTSMEPLIYQEVLYMQQYTGQTIGSTAIAEKYQPALIDLSAAAVLGNMELFGADATSYTLGDFTINKGGESTTQKAREYFKQTAMEKLKELGRASRFSKANG